MFILCSVDHIGGPAVVSVTYVSFNNASAKGQYTQRQILKYSGKDMLTF